MPEGTNRNYWTQDPVSRRRVLRGAAVGSAGFAGAAIIGCTTDDDPSTPTATPRPDGNGATPTPTDDDLVDLRTGESLAGAKRGGRLNIDHADEAVSLYNHIEETPGSIHAAQFVYEQLIERWENFHDDPGVINEAPLLAKDWEIADDQRWVFHLREGVQWQDIAPVSGRDFVAEDVVYSIEKMKGEGDPRVRMRTAFAPVESVETPDDQTVVIHTNEPYAPLDAALGHTWSVIVPHEIAETGDIENNAIGTGAYILDEWRRGVEVRYSPNPNYWDRGFPLIDDIRLRWVSDASARQANFRTGETTRWGTNYREERPEVIQTVADAVPGAVPREMPGTSGFRTAFDTSTEPFNDERLRQAAMFGMDYDAVLQLLIQGERYASFSPHNVKWAIPSERLEELAPYDPDRAAQLLSAAGYGPDNPLRVKTTVAQFYGGPSAAQVAQNFLRPIGFEIEIELMELAPWVERVYRGGGAYDMTTHADWTWEDADRGLFTYFHSNGAQNNTHYHNPDVDRLLERQRGIFDDEERREVVHEALETIVEEAPQVWWLVLDGITLTGGQMKNFRDMLHGNSNWFRQWRYVWLDE